MANALQQYMDDSGETQAQLGARIGRSQATVCRYLAKLPKNIDTLQILAAATETPLKQFLPGQSA